MHAGNHNYSLFPIDDGMMTTTQASAWATERTGRQVTPSNISYLVKYGRVPGIKRNGTLMISLGDLDQYYHSRGGCHEGSYRRAFGEDLNWSLSFEQFKESETTKHVHRLHPYKGKFIPQLVEYFIDSHTDQFKHQVYFSPGDIILDPFCGSGTTLVQSNESGIHAVGIDVSLFNSIISNLKLSNVELGNLGTATFLVENCIASNIKGQKARNFEEDLLSELKIFNTEFFPSPEFRYRVRRGEIDHDRYTEVKNSEFRSKFYALIEKHGVSNEITIDSDSFMDTWYHDSVRSEINSARHFIDGYSDPILRDILRVILSRTVRSARATTHSDLATLIRPVTETYYCGKHSKICKPLFSMLGWWKRYSKDTINRIAQFKRLRTNTMQICLPGDSREINILSQLEETSQELADLVRKQKIRGIFSSPPYVGMIDYHEQHAYAYELFNLPRNDDSEIGPLSSGRGRYARDMYAEGIAGVLMNCQQYMIHNYDVFLVANDKFELYPRIAEIAGMKIAKEYRRPVLNRSEGDKGAYSETIFHMRRSD